MLALSACCDQAKLYLEYQVHFRIMCHSAIVRVNDVVVVERPATDLLS